ncbi:cupin domain-containing protein [Haloarcula amylovorans]|uniref:cupin domain-containing protein n=1 Tax=Haloarcula amylovorans TaxID=2562280 RepID=UPI0010763D5F|nr:cupin domain-containing protein [Halomicroarcula amylolytica]
MTQDGSDPSRELTPTELDRTHLPKQTMYKVSLAEATPFEQAENAVTTYPLVVTNEFKLLYFEIEPGESIDWHTHTPGFDEVCLCLDGRARFTLERGDRSNQVLEIEPREFVYLPGGARHKIDAVGDRPHEGLVAMPPEPVSRMEMLEGASPYRFEEWPIALWVDRKRDEVVRRDEVAVSE